MVWGPLSTPTTGLVPLLCDLASPVPQPNPLRPSGCRLISSTTLITTTTKPSAPSWLHAAGCRFISGDTLVVDGANWMWKPAIVPRSAVSKVSRGVEAQSRAVGTAAGRPQSKV